MPSAMNLFWFWPFRAVPQQVIPSKARVSVPSQPSAMNLSSVPVACCSSPYSPPVIPSAAGRLPLLPCSAQGVGPRREESLLGFGPFHPASYSRPTPRPSFRAQRADFFLPPCFPQGVARVGRNLSWVSAPFDLSAKTPPHFLDRGHGQFAADARILFQELTQSVAPFQIVR